MGLADLIVDGASATLINKLQEELNNYNENTLEHQAHLEMLGNFEGRVVNAAKDYIKTYGDELAASAKDAVVKLGRDAAGALGNFTQKNLNLEGTINSTLSNILDLGSFDSLANAFGGGNKSFNTANERRGAISDFASGKNKPELLTAQKSLTNKNLQSAPSAHDYPKLTNFLTALTSNNPVYNLMHKYFFMTTITFLPETGNSLSNPLDDQIKLYQTSGKNYIQILTRRAEVPQLQSETTIIKNEFGHMSLPGKTTIPSDNSFILGFLSTEYSIHETLMLEWLKQTTSDTYHYNNRPFMKAYIDIDFFDQGFRQNILTYSFVDCFPQNIALLDPNYNDTSLNPRDVRFNFDYMRIHNYGSSTKTKDMTATVLPNQLPNLH